MCSTCRERKPLDDFYNDKRDKDGKTRRCKPCSNAITKVWVEVNPERRKAINRESSRRRKDVSRDYALRTKYGISSNDYDVMLLSQNGVCAVCGGGPSERYGTFEVDHNHETGEVRGLLCGNCNRGLGLLGESVDGLIAAAIYLIRSGDCQR